MYHKSEKCCSREEKRQEKQRLREAKRELKQRRREEKRQEKQRHREEKRRIREEFFARLFNLSLSDTTSTNNIGRSDVNNINENDVVTLRTIFPDCEPMYIRNCLANETPGNEGVRKVVEKLLSTSYPKVIPVTPSTPPTAPPANLNRNSFDDEAPPSYEEAIGGQSLQPPPLPNRHHQRSSSWGGNGTTSSQSRNFQYSQNGTTSQTRNSFLQNGRFSQFKINSQNMSRGVATEVTEQIGAAVKTLLDNFKPDTVEHACNKYNYIWSRPVPTWFKYKSFSKQIKILPKDKYSIQRGFNNQSNYPSKELRSRDISERDWYSFMSGLNSIIGVNSIKGSEDNIDGVSVGLKWVSWMNMAAMDDSLMETNVRVLNEYIGHWNHHFFYPRKITVQLIDNRIQSANKCEQYLLVNSIL